MGGSGSEEPVFCEAQAEPSSQDLTAEVPEGPVSHFLGAANP